VAAQVALSFLLLFGAGLFVRSLENLKTTDTGVELVNLITFQVAPALSGYDNARGTQFYERLLERLRTAPGIRSAGIASVPILSGWEWDSTMSVEGHSPVDGEDMQAYMNALSPGYFETMKISLVEGRDFRPEDLKADPDVAIVNRRFAEHFFPGAAPSAGGSAGAADRTRSSRSRSSASSPTRSTRGRARACVGRCSSPGGARAVGLCTRGRRQPPRAPTAWCATRCGRSTRPCRSTS
jgi:hypothetical protein